VYKYIVVIGVAEWEMAACENANMFDVCQVWQIQYFIHKIYLI